MAQKKRKKLKSWLIVYAVLCAAVIFTAQSRAVAPRDQTALSPVTVEGEGPLLYVDSVVRRSDL
jgi:hypothetical protein